MMMMMMAKKVQRRHKVCVLYKKSIQNTMWLIKIN
uniref:Uncharacterized protein n=1 Tax=Anguilla anguilla TaxID=7936 RepID=A0A0E9U5A4_ANGAN